MEVFHPKAANGRTLYFLADKGRDADIRRVILPLCGLGFQVSYLAVPDSRGEIWMECARCLETASNGDAVAPMLMVGDGLLANAVMESVCRAGSLRWGRMVFRNPVPNHPDRSFAWEDFNWPPNAKVWVFYDDDASGSLSDGLAMETPPSQLKLSRDANLDGYAIGEMLLGAP
jgi:hypothetical protein